MEASAATPARAPPASTWRLDMTRPVRFLTVPVDEGSTILPSLLSSVDMSNRHSLAQFLLICTPCNPSLFGLLACFSRSVLLVSVGLGPTRTNPWPGLVERGCILFLLPPKGLPYPKPPSSVRQPGYLSKRDPWLCAPALR